MEQNYARIINRLARKSQRYFGAALSKFNLTAAEQPFFMALSRKEGVTQEELTASVCVDKAATARAVKSLEEKGYLIRKRDEKDRRQNRLYLTQRAKQTVPLVSQELSHFNMLLVERVDPKHLDTIYGALQTMEENFLTIFENMDTNTQQGGRKDGTDR